MKACTRLRVPDQYQSALAEADGVSRRMRGLEIDQHRHHTGTDSASDNPTAAVCPAFVHLIAPRRNQHRASTTPVLAPHQQTWPSARAEHRREGMIILIGGEKGGTGKTTVATNLCACLATAERDVLLVDADRQGSARWWSDRRHETGGLPAVQCVQRYGRLDGTVRDMASRFDDVVIDCGGQDSNELRSAMLVAEVMFVPVQASILDLVTLQHVTELIDSAQINNTSLRANVFLSRAPTNQSSEETAALKALAQALPETMGVLKTVIHDRRAFRDAAKSGRGVLEWTDEKAVAEFSAFVSEIHECATGRTEAA